MADILFPESIPQGGAQTFGSTPAATPEAAGANLPVTAPQHESKGGGGSAGGKGGFLGSPWAKILLPIAAGGLGALTGGLAFPALGLGTAALGAELGGAVVGGLGSGIANKSPLAGLLGAAGGFGEG